MKLKGTKFQVKVWRFLEKIPVGSIKTYSQVAKGIGKPLAVRAVANAIAKNPKELEMLNTLSEFPAKPAIIAPTMITDDIALVTDINGVCNEGVTLHTT